MEPSSWSSLTLSEIVGALPEGTFTSTEKRCRSKLDEAVRSLPSEYVQILSDLASSKPLRKKSDLETNALFLADPSFYHSMRLLSMKEIAEALPPQTFTSRQKKSCATMEHALVDVSLAHQEQL